MTKNMGSTDRGLRVVLAILIGILYLTQQITGTAALVLGLVALGFLVTALSGFCPLYLPFKLSTCKKEPPPEQ